MRFRILVPPLAVLCLSTPTAAQDIIGRRDSLTLRVDSVFSVFDRTDRPGCALGVYREGQILYARGYGMANLELGIAITPKTVFDVGSVSKQFTAASVMLLANEGKLRLDDDVRRYVPEMPPYASGITIRRMLSHTSGLRDYLTLMSLADMSFEGVADTVDFLRFITRSATTNFPPGARYLYSNSGYVLSAAIIYRLSGEHLARFAKNRIFDPLGMTDTRFLDDHAAILPRRAQGYRPAAGRGGEAGGFAVQMSQFDGTGGAGSVHSTIEDLALWLRNYESKTVGGSWLDSLQKAVRLITDSAITYGMGQAVDTYRGLRIVGHGGSWAGYRAHVERYPDQRLAVACLCNVTNAGPDSLARKVAVVYLGSSMTPDTAAQWVAALAAAPARPAAPVEQLRAFEGVWKNTRLGEVRRTRVVNGRLALGSGTSPTPLDALGDRRFRTSRGAPTELTFDRDSAGVPSVLVFRTRGGSDKWQRMPAVALRDADLLEYTGDYYSAELDVTMAVAPDTGGRLAVRINGRRRGTLEPVYRDGFVNGNQLVDFTRERGRVTGYVLQSGRVRDLPFVRRNVGGAAAAGSR